MPALFFPALGRPERSLISGREFIWTRRHTTANCYELVFDVLKWRKGISGGLRLLGCDDLAVACRERGLTTHRFRWGYQSRDAGFKQDAAYLVRPDGYVAAALPEQRASALKTFLDRLGIRFTN